MNSTFKTCMCALALGLSGAAPLYAASATAACEQTHSILYAGADSQAIMKIKVTVTETSQILKGMTFSMAGTTSVSDIAKARISTPAPLPTSPRTRSRPTGGPSPSSTPSPRGPKPSNSREATRSPQETTTSGCAWTSTPAREG